MSVELRNRGGVGMVLIDAGIAERIPGLWAQAEVPDPVVHLKLFTVTGWRWFVLGLDPIGLMAYCYVTHPEDAIDGGEFGVVDLNDLANVEIFSGSLGVERDLWFKPCKLSQLRRTGAEQ
jgi:hypothetical protein